MVFNDSRCDENVLNGAKYLNHTWDASKFVECISGGVGLIHECNDEGPWSNTTWWIICNTRPVLNVTIGSNATSESFTCVNGVFDEYSLIPKCICLMNFVGDWCDVALITTNFTTYYEQILNGTFDIDTYTPWLKIKRGRPCFLIKFKSDPEQELVDYQSFIDHIVGNYWTQVDVQGYFMQHIDYENVWNSSNLSFQIQKMKLFTSKVYNDLEKNFVLYRRVLRRLSKIYKSSADIILRKVKLFGKVQAFSNFTAWEMEIKKEVRVALIWISKL